MSDKQNIKENGCKGCPRYIPHHYCGDGIIDCDFLLERDFFAGAITEVEYKKQLKEDEAAKISKVGK